MILLLGDIHGNASILKKASDIAEQAGATAIVQLGDFGLFPDTEAWFRENTKDAHVPIYFIDGNHDDCDRWLQYTDVSQVWTDRQLYYVPRGTVMEIDGRTVAFMGGASSINKKFILRDGGYWTPLEDIREEDIEKLTENSKGKDIDVFITHIPPHSVIQEHFDNTVKILFEVGPEWHDMNQTVVEDLWNKMGTPSVYSGHMHKRIVGEKYRILDMNELLAI